MRDLTLFVIVVGLTPIILMRPWVGILAWFWSGLMTPHLLTWGFMKTFPIAAAFGGATLAGLAIAMFISKDRRSVPMTREIIMMSVLVAYVTMTSYFAVNPSGAWSFWGHLMKILLITFITPVLIYGQKRIILLLLVITFSLAFYGFKGGIFAVLTGGSHMVLGPPGSYLEGNTYIGIAMIMVLPLVLATARMFYFRWVDLGSVLLNRLSGLIGLTVYGTFWLTAGAILATYSRGALLGLLAIAPFIFLRLRKKWLLVLLGFIAIGIVGVTAPDRLMARWSTIKTYEQDRSAMQRIQAWGVNWNMAKERPLRGMGFNFESLGYDWWANYANFEGDWHHVLSPHSIYFSLLGQHGIGGLTVFLILVGFCFMTLGRIRRTAKQRGDPQRWLAEYAWAMQIGLIGYLVAGTFLDVAYFSLFYAFVALAVVMRRELDETASDEQPTRSTREGSKPSPGLQPRFPGFVPSLANHRSLSRSAGT